MLLALTYLKGFNILIMRKPKFYMVESDVYCLWEKYDNFYFNCLNTAKNNLFDLTFSVIRFAVQITV